MEGPPPVDGDNAQNEIGTEAGKVIGVIGDEDTVTGFLLAGVGMKDTKGSNFLVVNASAWGVWEGALDPVCACAHILLLMERVHYLRSCFFTPLPPARFFLPPHTHTPTTTKQSPPGMRWRACSRGCCSGGTWG